MRNGCCVGEANGRMFKERDEPKLYVGHIQVKHYTGMKRQVFLVLIIYKLFKSSKRYGSISAVVSKV
jgi:hypothetical protein